jgi:hypothetical protein
MVALPEKLQRFYLEALPWFHLPALSQKVVTVMSDRDSGAEQLLQATQANPSAAGWLALEWERATGRVDEEKREVDYWIPRLGIERCRRAWLRGQLQARWDVPVLLTYSERISQKVESFSGSKDPSYGDSAFLAGLLFDLLEMGMQRQRKQGSTEKLIFESRVKRFERGLENLITLTRSQKNLSAKRWIAGAAATVAVTELWLHLDDPSLSAEMLKWEARGYPCEIRRLLVRRALGFSPKVLATWVADAFPTLESYREGIRWSDTPAQLASDRKELFELATLLGSTPEMS